MGVEQSALWCSLNGLAPPRRIIAADDTLPADAAYRMLCEGCAILWRGDYHNARQLLQALARRIERKKSRSAAAPDSLNQAFHTQRKRQAERARILGGLLLPFAADFSIPLRRAPDTRLACAEAFAEAKPAAAFLMSLREVLGLIGAHEWRRQGVEVAPLQARIHPHYGVFAPTRTDYLELVAAAPLPAALGDGAAAFDIGTGSGVLAAILARRGVRRIVATELQPRALACARENMARLGLSENVDVIAADLFPPGKAALIVCNPPWLPVKPTSALDAAVYDPDGRMLQGFIAGLRAHLLPNGEGWLILSDLAEHLGLRSRVELTSAFEQAGLQVLGRLDVPPRHPKAADRDDPLFAARRAEIVSLWRLAPH